MPLVDYEIEEAIQNGQIRILPIPTDIRGTDIDLHIGSHWLLPIPSTTPIELCEKPQYKELNADIFLLRAGECVLVYTLEIIHLEATIIGNLVDKSSVARNFLSTFNGGSCRIKGGFGGRILLELKNNGVNTLILRTGMACTAIEFEVTQQPLHPYNGMYQGQGVS